MNPVVPLPASGAATDTVRRRLLASAGADVSVRVPSDSTQYIQEAHVALGHVICEPVEHELFPA